MLSKIVDLITLIPELVPLFSKLVDTLRGAKTKEEKIDIMTRATLSAAARASFLQALPGK
jgi:hypothetical protein